MQVFIRLLEGEDFKPILISTNRRSECFDAFRIFILYEYNLSTNVNGINKKEIPQQIWS